MGAAVLWDVFCRVIDNHGDLGVCWRLAVDLAERDHHVRLWVDDARALAWMAPAGHPGVTVLPWRDPHADESPGDVVIEAFGCDPPASFVQAMQERRRSTWVNLEYLSAEPYVERCHGLASPQGSGPGAGLTKWFFYPGFTSQTGGLLREADLARQQAGFDREAFLRRLGIPPGPHPLVSVFAYPGAPVAALLARLAPLGAHVLACPGTAQALVLAQVTAFPSLKATALPWLTQQDYDHLLWSTDLNLVRGEDSFVRAQWAGAPFLWQIYVQEDGVHGHKLEAFLQRFLAGAPAGQAEAIAGTFRAWNGLGPWPDDLPPLPAWREQVLHWRARLRAQHDLASTLESFVATKR